MERFFVSTIDNDKFNDNGKVEEDWDQESTLMPNLNAIYSIHFHTFDERNILAIRVI